MDPPYLFTICLHTSFLHICIPVSYISAYQFPIGPSTRSYMYKLSCIYTVVYSVYICPYRCPYGPSILQFAHRCGHPTPTKRAIHSITIYQKNPVFHQESPIFHPSKEPYIRTLCTAAAIPHLCKEKNIQ